MCGICGELRFDGASPDMRAVERMSEQLARRGPDQAGTFADGPLAFGHRRLAIIDLSPSADQPMVDAALQLALVFNGTIYNYGELRTELLAMGYVFFSGGDSEGIDTFRHPRQQAVAHGAAGVVAAGAGACGWHGKWSRRSPRLTSRLMARNTHPERHGTDRTGAARAAFAGLPDAMDDRFDRETLGVGRQRTGPACCRGGRRCRIAARRRRVIDLAALLLTCAPLVAQDTAHALVQVESGGNLLPSASSGDSIIEWLPGALRCSLATAITAGAGALFGAVA